MVKTKVIEITEKYDKDGKLVEKVTREENTEDDTDYTDKGNLSFNKELFSHDDIKKEMKVMPQGISFWY